MNILFLSLFYTPEPVARLRMGCRARQVAQDKYDIEHIVPQLLELYSWVGNLP
jgi:hypothetical protein